MKHTFLFMFSLLLTGWVSANPNPIISRGKAVHSSNGTISYLTDNKFGGSTFPITTHSWLALHLDSGYNEVFFTWNNPNYTWSDVVAADHSCKQNVATAVNYTLQKSSNSTNGIDGQWTILTTISGNTVTARGHLLDLGGTSWIKMTISNGGGNLDEVEVFDMSATGTDTWFFTGTSISANTFKASPPSSHFADLVTQAHPHFTPAMIRGGIPCINSGDLAKDISLYLAAAGNVKHWGIEMGTNDAWGGTNGGVATFKTNMQTVITACKNAGIQPILARVIGTNAMAANWQVHPDYLKAIDDLTSQNNLIAGPDLYTHFVQHPEDLSTDGVHPNALGAANIQRLWAQKVTGLYTVTDLSTVSNTSKHEYLFPTPSTGNFDIHASPELVGSLFEIYDLKGSLAYKKLIPHTDSLLSTHLPSGAYVLKISGGQKAYSQKIVIK